MEPTRPPSIARPGASTWDSIIVSKLPFNIVPLEDSASTGTRLGQSHIEIAGVKEGFSGHRREGQGLVQHEICRDGGGRGVRACWEVRAALLVRQEIGRFRQCLWSVCA